MQVNDRAHLGISANLALVAGAVVQSNILDFEYPVVTFVIVYGGKSGVADVGIPAGGEDFVCARP